MTPFEREQMKRAAQARLATMRERAARLRRRVLVGAAIGFTVLWIAIFAQMITGHDPALGPATATIRTPSIETARFEEEAQIEVEAEEVDAAETEEAEAAEAEAIEAEELEAATTGQS